MTINAPFIDCYIEAFAVVREAAKRKLGMRHFDVQVLIFLCIKIKDKSMYDCAVIYP